MSRVKIALDALEPCFTGWSEATKIYGVVVEQEQEQEQRQPRAVELIDVGVNLTHRQFDRDRDEVIDRAARAGVTTMVITGTTVPGSRSAAWLAKTRPGKLYATAGVHPHHAKDCGPNTIDDLRALAREKEIVAVGECGLDFNRNFSPPEVQERWFEAQLELAAELKLPLFMHERDASARFAEIYARH